MDITLKANLKEILQKWLHQNADDIGTIHGIWQDGSIAGKTALMLTNACEVVIDSMEHQIELEEENNPRE